MADFKTGSVQANGINFHYLEMGEGPLALCLHGFPDHAYSFRRLLPDLAEAGFRAVAPFMRGYAPTEAPKDGNYRAVLLARDAVALVDALGGGRAYLIGNDWGAGAVIGATVLAPEKVHKLIIIASGRVDEELAMDYWYLRGHLAFLFLPDALRGKGGSPQRLRLCGTVVAGTPRRSGTYRPMPLESIRETFRKPGVVEAALGYYRARFGPAPQDPETLRDEERINAGPVTVPTLALHGTRDRPKRLESFESEAMDAVFHRPGWRRSSSPAPATSCTKRKPEEINPKHSGVHKPADHHPHPNPRVF